MEGGGRLRAKTKRSLAATAFSLVIIVGTWVQAAAEWETGARLGFDSNVDRAIEGGRSDSWLSAYLSFFREPGGESRTDWTLSATMEGSAFARFHDLDCILLTAAPGVNFILHRTWTIQASPFIQIKGVKDEDQSCWTLGGRLSMKEEITKNLYAGQYYIYRNSEAQEDVYSFTENALGAYLGMNWTRTFFTEIGYEYSHGDSFQAIGVTSTAPSSGLGRTLSTGRGRGREVAFSPAFERVIVKEKVDRHSIGISAGIDWTRSLFSLASYAYTTMEGDLGTSSSHAGFIGLGYRF